MDLQFCACGCGRFGTYPALFYGSVNGARVSAEFAICEDSLPGLLQTAWPVEDACGVRIDGVELQLSLSPQWLLLR
jgi:hypothetical protein